MNAPTGTPEHAAAILAEVRAAVKLEWEPGTVEAVRVKGTTWEDPETAILHFPGEGWAVIIDIRGPDGIMFDTLEEAQAEAHGAAVYRAAMRKAEAEGIPYEAMADALEGRTGGNVVGFTREAKA